jgi:hypothetical protein
MEFFRVRRLRSLLATMRVQLTVSLSLSANRSEITKCALLLPSFLRASTDPAAPLKDVKMDAFKVPRHLSFFPSKHIDLLTLWQDFKKDAQKVRRRCSFLHSFQAYWPYRTLAGLHEGRSQGAPCFPLPSHLNPTDLPALWQDTRDEHKVHSFSFFPSRCIDLLALWQGDQKNDKNDVTKDHGKVRPPVAGSRFHSFFPCPLR